jgi:hypothetical protein
MEVYLKIVPIRNLIQHNVRPSSGHLIKTILKELQQLVKIINVL